MIKYTKLGPGIEPGPSGHEPDELANYSILSLVAPKWT